MDNTVGSRELTSHLIFVVNPAGTAGDTPERVQVNHAMITVKSCVLCRIPLQTSGSRKVVVIVDSPCSTARSAQAGNRSGFSCLPDKSHRGASAFAPIHSRDSTMVVDITRQNGAGRVKWRSYGHDFVTYLC